ncbi:MAG TPA: hypothetical protein VLM76_11850 [Patescibacteria group bacterium]|nr:hypothetical protein [Patescibacteria group bacterium]
MSTSPLHLRRLRDYWVARGGVHLGIVGSMASHCRGYHLGRDRIYGPVACRRGGVPRPGQGDSDYSVMTARDRAGLSGAASAIDLGRLGGSLAALYHFSRWLVERARANAPGTDAIREIIYSPDGRTVLRWDRERGHTSAPRPGEGDASHLTHTHISFYRDARESLLALLATYPRWPVPVVPKPVVVKPAPKPPVVPKPPPETVTVKAGANVRRTPALDGVIVRTTRRQETWTLAGWVRGARAHGSDRWASRAGRREFTHDINVKKETK